MRTFELGTNRVAIADVVDVARNNARIAIGPAAFERLQLARDVVERAAQGDQSIYGVTSALGANTGKALDPDERALYQIHAVRARAVGVGPALTP